MAIAAPPAGGTGPAEPAAAHPFDPYDVTAFSVRRDVPAGTTVDLTLTFQRAGRIVTAAYVQPKAANIVEPVRRCAPGVHAPRIGSPANRQSPAALVGSRQDVPPRRGWGPLG